MKTKLTALALIAATGLSLMPKPAMAGDRETALVGGLIGGVIIGTALADSHRDHTTVVVSGRNDRCDEPRGYWKEVTTRVWVPGCWIAERRHHVEFRRFVPGHYELRTDRVWVSYDRYDRHDGYGHHDREVGYGYGRR